jgi:mandelate racemase
MPAKGGVPIKRRPEVATPFLTVRAIRTVAVDVPMARPLGTSAQTMRTAPMLLIDLETEEGITGHAYLFCYTRMAPGLIATMLGDIQDAVRGERLAPIDFSTRLLQRYRLLGAQGIVRMALAGFDVACWDALSLAAGLPLASYVGSQPRPIQAYNSNGLGLTPPEQAADEAEALLECGFRAVKLRLGRPTAEQDRAAVRAVRRRLPDTVALMADYNQALTVTEAIRRGQGLDGEGLCWIEEPTRHGDCAGCARGAATLATPVQIGENFAGAQAMAAALSANACDYVMPDLERIGGVTGWQRRRAGVCRRDRDVVAHLPGGQCASARRYADLPLAGICRLGGADPGRTAAHRRRHGAGAGPARFRRVVGSGRRQTLSNRMRAI